MLKKQKSRLLILTHYCNNTHRISLNIAIRALEKWQGRTSSARNEKPIAKHWLLQCHPSSRCRTLHPELMQQCNSGNQIARITLTLPSTKTLSSWYHHSPCAIMLSYLWPTMIGDGEAVDKHGCRTTSKCPILRNFLSNWYARQTNTPSIFLDCRWQ